MCSKESNRTPGHASRTDWRTLGNQHPARKKETNTEARILIFFGFAPGCCDSARDNGPLLTLWKWKTLRFHLCRLLNRAVSPTPGPRNVGDFSSIASHRYNPTAATKRRTDEATTPKTSQKQPHKRAASARWCNRCEPDGNAAKPSKRI